MTIKTRVAERIKKLDNKFTAEQQKLIKNTLIDSFLEGLKDCQDYENSKISPEQRKSNEDLAAKTGIKPYDYYGTKIASFNSAVEGDGHHLYDVIEAVIKYINLYNLNKTPYSCRDHFISLENDAADIGSSSYMELDSNSILVEALPDLINLGPDFNDQ